jgi:hypothetical protein
MTDRELPTSTLRRRQNTDAPINDPAISDVNKRVSVVRQKLWLRQEAGTRQDQHPIDTDKLNGVTDL